MVYVIVEQSHEGMKVVLATDLMSVVESFADKIDYNDDSVIYRVQRWKHGESLPTKNLILFATLEHPALALN